MQYITRISFNGSGWRRPTREAQDYEEAGTYNNDNGFGLEDWLFRSEWILGGWRYAFLQGVNHSYNRLVKENKPFDVTLFTFDQPIIRRRYVATIHQVECLRPDQAQDAERAFRKNGWFDLMKEDIRRCNGRPDALEGDRRSKYWLNIRYRLENLSYFEPEVFAEPGDPILRMNYYTLNSLEKQAERLEKEAAQTTCGGQGFHASCRLTGSSKS